MPMGRIGRGERPDTNDNGGGKVRYALLPQVSTIACPRIYAAATNAVGVVCVPTSDWV